jgi:hypothetical protein
VAGTRYEGKDPVAAEVAIGSRVLGVAAAEEVVVVMVVGGRCEGDDQARLVLAE